MRQALPDVVLEDWRHAATGPMRLTILPDGCRDLIVAFPRHAAARCFVSPLHSTAETVECAAGDRYVGYRLHPAAVFDAEALLAAVHGRAEADEAALLAVLDGLARRDANLAEALAALASTASVAAARRTLGVAERSLERLVAHATGRPPAWWQGLARARRAARALTGGDSLAGIACAAGYADQAHMSREFRRWFGMPPGRLRADPALLAGATASGYG